MNVKAEITRDEFTRQIRELSNQSRWIDPAKLTTVSVLTPDQVPTIAPIDPAPETLEIPVPDEPVADVLIASEPEPVVLELVVEPPPSVAHEESSTNGHVEPAESNTNGHAEAAECDRQVEPSKSEDSEIDEDSAKDDRLSKLPEEERPRERMRSLGPEGITTSELLAILLGSGRKGRNVKNVADELLTEFEGLAGLSRASTFNMRNIGGIGEVKADMLAAAFELGRRAELNEEDALYGAKNGVYGADMSGPEQIIPIIAEHFTTRLRNKAHEEMWVVFMDVRNHYRGKARIYIGCCDRMLAKAGEVLSRVVERNMPRFAIIHNHPSGRGTPSSADVKFTERLVKASDHLDIRLIEHIVLGEDMESYVSMQEHSLVNFNP